MAWEKIIGQNRVKRILQRAILEERIPHAYCFWGIEGIGKDALAFEFAKIVNCKNPKIEGFEIEACENCSSCRQANLLQHPNIQFIFSLPTGQSASTRTDSALEKLSDDQINRIREEIGKKASDPYYKISIQGANQIKIASIRDIKKSLSLSGSQQGRRMIIISRADEMTPESANAFLKSLEEPSPNTSIVITTSRKEAILPTVISRCQQIMCEPLSETELSDALQKRYEIPEQQAVLMASIAQGSYLRALEYMDEDMRSIRESVVEIMRIALKRKMFRLELTSKIEEITKQKDKQKNEIFLILLLVWLRDAYNLSKSTINSIVNIDQEEVLKRFAMNFGNKNLPLAIEEIEKAILRLKRNVAPNLVYINLFIKLREYFF